MSAYDCIGKKAAAGKVSKAKSESARKRIKEIEEALNQQGTTGPQARKMAEDRYAEELKFKKADQKWRLINRVRVMRQLQAAVDAAPVASLGKLPGEMMNQADFEARAIHRMIMGRVGKFLEKHRVTMLGNVSNPASFRDFLRALHGESVSDAGAKAMADAVSEANEWIRKTLNSYGHNIGKLDGWGMPHSHNALSIGTTPKADFFAFLDSKLDWAGMVNPKTGMEFGAVPNEAYRREFIDAMHDNLSYGRNSRNPQWSINAEAGGLEKHRVLKFNSADDWIAYNDRFGSADPHSTILQHFDQMSRQIAIAKELGRDAETALDYLDQLIDAKNLEKQTGIKAAMTRGLVPAKNMLRIMQGGIGPQTWMGAQSARFFSTTRKVLNAALLDRAIVISVPSDLNSAFLAADAIKMNPKNFLSTYVGLMNDARKGGGVTRADLLRAGHIAESWANPGVTSSRFQAEYPTAAWADKVSNFAMRIQGMNAHTDSAKLAWSWSMSGHLASISDQAFDALPQAMRDMMRKSGIEPSDWDAFRTGPKFTASNGAEFLSPLHWQTAATHVDPIDADRLFLKFQSFVERWQEIAVPSRSLYAQGALDPRAYNLAPGSLLYETVKSAGMFKSFVGAFVVNQATMIRLMPTPQAKAWYVGKLVGSTTIVGALAIQLNEMLMGRDPQEMNADFIFRSMLRGGGLGPAGDILFAGSASYGGGIGSYLAGPIPAAGGDLIKLTLGNVIQAYQQAKNGDDIDVSFMKELLDFQSRYTPLWQTPVAAGGAALDRLISQELLMALDPEGYDKLMKKETARENRYGNASWWMPGSPMPSRAPDLTAAFR